jgi:hypothetical protein
VAYLLLQVEPFLGNARRNGEAGAGAGGIHCRTMQLRAQPQLQSNLPMFPGRFVLKPYLGTGTDALVPRETGMRGPMFSGKCVFEPVGNGEREVHYPTGGGGGRSTAGILVARKI